MDRGREARRGVTMAASNGLSRRRHRSNSLRDSPEEDGTVELQETARLRDRKKDRDRDRDRERDRERDRDRLNRNSKRRRSDKFMHGSNREDGGEDSSEESVNDDEEDDEDDGVGIGGGNSSVRMLPPNPPQSSSSVLNHHHHHHHHNSNSNNINSHHSRKSYPPPAKVFRASPAVSTTTSTWKAADEMIGVSVPRKARSASTKRSHECWSSGGVVVAGSGEQIHRQTSTSPIRQSTAAVLATPAPASPSSSNASARKKMKPSGPKPRPPKSSGNNKPSSSAQDEIEIEIAEVLYGMMRQPQCPSKQDTTDSISRDNNNNNINKSSNDAKSRVSSPISNSPSTAPLSSSVIPSNSSSSTAPITASAPKRKRPRPVKYEEENLSTLPVRNSPISSATKMETDQPAKPETSSPPHLEKNSGSVAAENGSFSYDLMSSQASEPPQLEVEKPESKPLLADSKGLTEVSESGGDMTLAKDEPQSPNKEPGAGAGAGVRLEDERRENLTLTKNNPIVSGIENQREEKFQIDLMAPPFRSSPERDGETDFASMDLQPEMKPQMKEDVKAVAVAKDKDDANTETEEKNAKTIIEESESQKPIASRDRNLDLQLDLEKNGRDSTTGPSNKLHQHAQKQQQPQPPVVPEKTALSNSLPLPLSMASWPGGLPPMGYMAPLQGVVSIDGSNVSSATIQPPHLLFTQPRPKRCATHCYIARNVHYHQQFTRMNPFWPAAAGSASLYGAKACNLNVVPPADLNANIPGRGVNTIHDKGQGLAIFAGNNSGKDNKGSQPANIIDASQRKQILLQQAIPPGAPNNLLQAPAFIFPLSQQAAAAASVRPGSAKPPAAVGSAVSSSVSNAVSASTTGGAGGAAAAAAAMGFSYPNMPGSETQYLAILQNNAYPFPISAAHVGAPPAYRGTHAQPMPFFNGSFYSSQMLHPSQLHQPQQQQQLPAQSQQIQHGGHQNTSISSGSSSSQKHLQNQQQQRQQSINGGSGTMQGFPPPKNQPQQQLQQHHQQRQLQQNQQSETGGEESPSTADSRVSRMSTSIYGQNFAMPGHPPPTFALMSNATMGGATTVSGNHGDKKPQQQQQQPPTFPMSFAPINGATTAPGFDLSSIAQNPAILQNLPEAMRHGYQIMAAAQAAQQKKNYRISEESNKTRGNDASPILEEENKSSMAGKPPATTGQSIAFSRPDLTDGQVSSVVDTSTRPLNLGSASARSSLSNVNVSAAQQQQQMQRNQQQQQHQQHQMIQLQKQQQFAAAAAAAAARNKTPATSNGNVFSDHIPSSSSMAAKFPTALSGFPQNLVQNSSSSGPGQSPQWKNSVRINTSQVTSYPLAASTSSSLKNLSQQQQGRTQQSHTVISFATNPNPKTSISAAQGQQGTPSNNNNNSSSSPPVMVGSPTSSVSKISAGGSPRTTATPSSGGNKGSQGQASSFSSQQAKNSPSVPSRKSSPVPSILGNPNTGSKLQMTQQQHQQQLQKQALQQAQLLFTNASAYMQAQAQAQQAGSNTSSAMAAGGLFMQRHRDQQLQQQMTSSSTGVLSLCPPVTTHSNTATSDPAKAVAAANNMKGGGGIVHPVQFSTSQSSGKSHQLVPAGFSNVHAVPTAVQVKPTEQKQPAGE